MSKAENDTATSAKNDSSRKSGKTIDMELVDGVWRQVLKPAARHMKQADECEELKHSIIYVFRTGIVLAVVVLIALLGIDVFIGLVFLALLSTGVYLLILKLWNLLGTKK